LAADLESQPAVLWVTSLWELSLAEALV
jgi:hypothetical protein